jgi:predicted lipid-binding transport protein (Tim44 family)
VQVEDQASRAIYVRLRHRARVLRGLAIGFVVLIALTLAFGTIPYFLAGSMAVTESRAALEMRRAEAEQHAKTVEKRDRAAEEAADAAPPTQPQPPAQPAAASAAAAGPIAGLAVGDEAFSAAVIRITDVFLLVALTYLFGSLYRYSMRLASYYDEKADALRLLEAGDRQIEARLSQITIPGAPGNGEPERRGERS